MISPAVLTLLLASGLAQNDDSVTADVEFKTAFKTWLGLRYDRPAVPPEHVELARRIAQEIERQGRAFSTKVRDVLVQFQTADPTIFMLHAIVLHEETRDEVSEWLTGASLRIPPALGVLGGVEAQTDEHTSLRLIETSFAVDLSQITWGGRPLRGQPGRLSRPIQT